MSALALASFGPYIIGGMRTEQAAVYGLAVLILPFTIGGLRTSGRFFLPWLLYVTVATLGVMLPTSSHGLFRPGSIIAGLDNILLPLGLMLLIWSVVPTPSAEPLLASVSRIISISMAANGALAIISTRTDLTPLLRPFWTTGGEGVTTAELAASMGRYGGIFNQPAEAGALYGIAGIAAIYVWKSRPLWLALILTLITLGGLISVSKVFILGGLPLIVFYWLWSQRSGRKVGLLFGMSLLALGVVQSGVFSQWTGFNYLVRLINPTGSGGALGFYTAGRFESGSALSGVVGSILALSPISGVGAGGWEVPYDSAITESLVVAGLLGLVLYGVVIVGIFGLARKTINRHRQMFIFLFGIVTLAGSLGFSPLTANRVSTVSWLLITLFVLCAREDRRHVPSVLTTRGESGRYGCNAIEPTTAPVANQT